MKKKDFSPSILEMGNCIKETISRRPEGSTMAPQGGIDYKYVTSKQIKKKKQYSSKLKKQDAPLCLGYHSFISACGSETKKDILSGPERAHTNFRISGCKLKVCIAENYKRVSTHDDKQNKYVHCSYYIKSFNRMCIECKITQSHTLKRSSKSP